LATIQDSRDTLSSMLSTGLALGSGITGAALNFTGAALNLAQSAVRRAGTPQSTFQQVQRDGTEFLHQLVQFLTATGAAPKVKGTVS
jgi:hypothetical protein